MTSPAPASGPDTAALRKSLRSSRIALREKLPETQRHALTRQIETHLTGLVAQLQPASLAFCWPWRGEVDLRPWMTAWLAADPARRGALPVVVAPEAPMSFVEWRPDAAMGEDLYGIPVPLNARAVAPDVLLVPLNVFDGAGFRLGYGGGYFDRTLAALNPAPTCVGVAFELARADSTFPQPHDQPMDWIVTEAGVSAPSR